MSDDDEGMLINDDEDEDMDFSSLGTEPLVIRLMASMFSQKKSVQEGLEMLPPISLDKVRREIDYMRA
jgi:hypothetical protein